MLRTQRQFVIMTENC